MGSLITKEMSNILSNLSSTEDLYQFIINSSKSIDIELLEVCDGKKYSIKINSETYSDSNDE